MQRKLLFASVCIVMLGCSACGNRNSGTQTNTTTGISGTEQPAGGAGVMESTTTPAMQGQGTTSPAAPRATTGQAAY